MNELDLIPDPSVPDDPALRHWTGVAAEVAAKLRADVIERDAANMEPHTEMALLREHGLLSLTVPAEFGGHGQPWRTGLQVSRLIARTDASVAHILAYHYAWLRVLEYFRTPESDGQLRETAARGLVWASPGHNRAGFPKLIPVEGGQVVTGDSGFATGAPVCDRIFTRVVHAGTGRAMAVALDAAAEGIAYTGTWDVLGQRLTASREITLTEVPVPDAAILADLGPLDAAPPPYQALGVLNFQLIFGTLQLGVAEGALLEGAEYTRTRTRPWYHSLVEKGSDEPFILQGYGGHVARLQAVSALVDRAEKALLWLYERGEEATPAERAAVAETIVSLKISSTEASLTAASELFDLTGARSTATDVGLGRFWRDLRTLSLHDPVAYKQHELGRYFVNGHEPEASGYR
ncbi:alkylation response protein AidB-like acyl-CoA dehydrogenase [Actinocorallia herbida]|uniref:Alkylation response protein AidB-like acyl-CoA dehydrogenase n=1 Tax=Actinocorallia herbida TaxID=58109 RepID=A0A3N1CXG1_9ACTN|nr:acyl-CoA dehydrogenase family protein [Actinocorallia herbida]ROO85408.1 alkylation response protein AidB-like acyl-CoA dehydrogenase [Actinocorallia herbida]